MKKILQHLAMAVGLAVLAVGCASGPKYAEYRAQLKPPDAGFGRVWFYRPSSLGMAVQPTVQLDDRNVGTAVPRGFFQVQVLPGDHTVKCTTEWTHQTTITVSTNIDTYVCLEMMLGVFVGHVIPKEVTENRAIPEIKDLHHTGGD
jgi:hypothetical protein